MKIKLVLLLSILIALCSCSDVKTYVLHSDLPHQESYTLLYLKKDSICTTNCKHMELDSCNCNFKPINKNQIINYHARKRVLEIDSIFYIKKFVKSKKINEKYTNRFVRF